ncbi:class I adenylate-forming enzyme family protein [Haloarchaeobius sp. HRN-SO-5]|uniref:class I adenylate-forming enzyme family protein n=1 Tax=Haloarchaeobius sp. HRN-SO-5 TaxID=3446118 RepID=UPI003EBD9A1B
MDMGQMLAQSAARFGDDLAVACLSADETRTRSFAALDQAANRVANGFLDHGVGFGDPVAVLSHNSIEFVETLFATQKIGAPVVPINVRFDAADVEHVLTDADPACLVAEPDLLAELDGIEDTVAARDVDVVTVGDHGEYHSYEDLADSSTTPPGITVGADAEDGYFYTSGSTGRPKGVVHTHSDRVFVNVNVVSEFGLRRDDVNCNPLPLFHSGPLYTGFMPFVQFGVPSIVLRRFDPELTLDAIEEWDVTVLGGVPAQYDRISKAAAESDSDLDSMRFWWVSGAPLTEELRDRCHETLCDTHSIVYGATEVGPPVSTLPPEESHERPGSCGTGHMGQEVRVVEPDGDPDPGATVDPGETGELVVEGESVMDRYLNLPEKTESVLVDGWYFTGDLARRDADGYLYVEGRKDDMIISGGENVYPSELENVLLGHPAVDDVAVLGVSHPEWGQTPKAFVVTEPDASLDADDVEQFCKESHLADYKRPREVAFVPEIPRNPSGGSVLKDELTSIR